jgi:hypothetical protein
MAQCREESLGGLAAETYRSNPGSERIGDDVGHTGVSARKIRLENLNSDTDQRAQENGR